ncbi:hypothetical protein GALMADRAFT_234036 [Galerina marginata CBS 339.88]|uniref:GYF domain-containing protein n=1 Tax=Galerina marginata (strain CBS 339.88) TaxID=685588 RepID=A0A067TSH5_GALM3|nr:hypothetical protein GALMADRAFT_234036 [Galerina marginata CBS 339.88]
MSTTTMHFGPEWMRTKHQPLPRSQPPPSPPPTNVMPSSGLSTYSALVSATPPVHSEVGDDVHPFRYSKEELIKIYQDGGGKGGLGLEVERWEGVVREGGIEPIGLREMTEAEKKLFAGALNSELRRRPSQSMEYLSPLTTAGLDRPRLTHNSSSTTASSPMRERFGALKRRDSAAGASDTTMPALPRKPSLSALQNPALSPREAPRARVGYAPGFDGVLNNGESWMARRRTSETATKPGSGSSHEAVDNQHDFITSGIREEKEDDSRMNAQPRTRPDPNFLPSSSPRAQSDEPRPYATAGGTGSTLNASQVNSFPATGTINGEKLLSDHKDVGPPPGLMDLAAVEWSYKDPTGQVQGPFRADLMQKWYNDGYFSSDLPMKRIRYDTQWTTVAELVQWANGENIFFSSSLASHPLGRSGSPSQNYPPPEHTLNEPFQPAPIRSLRPSTLESYINSGSLPSDSPSSSVGASHFGNHSPDPSAFGGRDVKGYFGGEPNGRFSGYGAQDRSLSFAERQALGLDLQTNQTNNIHAPSFGDFVPDRDPRFNGYGYNNVSVPPDSWAMSSSLPSSALTATRNQRGDSSFLNPPPPADLGQLRHHPEIINGDRLLKPYDQGMIYTNDDLGSFSDKRTGLVDPNAVNYGHYEFAGQSSFQHIQDQNQQQYVPPMQEYGDGYALHGPNTRSSSNISSTQPPGPPIPWTALLESHRLGQPEAIPTSKAVLASPWDHNEQLSVNTALANDSATPETTKAPRKDQVPGSLTAGNPGQYSQQPVSSEKTDEPKPSVPELNGPSHAPAESVSVSNGLILNITQPITKKPVKASQANHQAPPSALGDTATSTIQKTAWAKEEEGKRKTSFNTSVSLRDIQEAEARKLETRKVAEREKERLARASSAAETKEDLQPFTASWGLPTSQAGTRSTVPVGDAPVVPAPTPVSAPVWTTPLKQPTTKKTMKEIQEEEEVRKRLSSRETLPAVVQKRAYADTTTKVVIAPPPTLNNNAWTTVGPSGKISAAVPPPIRPSQPSTLSSAASPGSSARVVVSPVQKVVASSMAKARQPTKQDEVPESPSHDFLKWISDSLKGLNSSVNVEEIVSMLLSFPLDPDPSTVEIISDTIYSNSTTLDGRRFASEFVTKRKADAVARARGASTSGKAPMKPVSIADVVKATPKTTQPEWGFKVVNKKKKGGRS